VPVTAAADSPPVARLREAGAIFIASTTMPDLSGIGSGVSSRHGITRNAWNPAWNPAGSSSGAGVAAALGYAPINIGTDIGGSVRAPASFNAVVGFKPSFGRVPILDTYTGRVAGPMSRTVADTALAMSALALPDDRDWSALPAEVIDWSDLEIDVSTLRIGLSLEPVPGARATPEVEEIVRRAAETFRAGGAEVEEISPYLTPESTRSWMTLFSAHLWAQLHDPRIIDDIEATNPEFVQALAPVADMPALELIRGIDGVQELIAQTVAAIERFDIVLSPVLWMAGGDAESLMSELGAGPSFTPQHNATGAPAVSINAGFTAEGRPVGLQIVGPRRQDLRVLQVANWFETHRVEEARPKWSKLNPE
jgi:Asp-tRNA(Asn)/Glu-tRNA(Gln) amidotransferase A subunit family amidase